ncbi:MAG: hypothetical protein R3A48_04350 [Polyangiales bacterium]
MNEGLRLARRKSQWPCWGSLQLVSTIIVRPSGMARRSQRAPAGPSSDSVMARSTRRAPSSVTVTAALTSTREAGISKRYAARRPWRERGVTARRAGMNSGHREASTTAPRTTARGASTTVTSEVRARGPPSGKYTSAAAPRVARGATASRAEAGGGSMRAPGCARALALNTRAARAMGAARRWFIEAWDGAGEGFVQASACA